MRIASATAALVAAVLAVALAVAAAPPVRAGEDPLRPLEKAMDRQDALTREGRFDDLLREAESAAKDGTPDSL